MAQAWYTLLQFVGVVSIMAIACGVILGALKLHDAVRYLSALIAAIVLLIVLPQIIVGSWVAMSIWQHLGVIAISVGLGMLLFKTWRSRGKKAHHGKSRH